MARGNGTTLDRKAVEALVALAPRYGSRPDDVGSDHVAEQLRRLFGELAGSVGVELARPSMPRKDEHVVEAAARLLPLPHVLEAVEANRARRRLLAQARAEVGGWQSELLELQRAELVRRQDELESGRLPGLAPPEAAARAARLFDALLLLDAMPGTTRANRVIVPDPEPDPDPPVMLRALRPPDWVPTLLYAIAVVDRLTVTANAKGSAPRDAGGFSDVRRLANLASERSDEPRFARMFVAITTWVRPFSSASAVLEEAFAAEVEPAA